MEPAGYDSESNEDSDEPLLNRQSRLGLKQLEEILANEPDDSDLDVPMKQTKLPTANCQTLKVPEPACPQKSSNDSILSCGKRLLLNISEKNLKQPKGKLNWEFENIKRLYRVLRKYFIKGVLFYNKKRKIVTNMNFSRYRVLSSIAK